jgi:acetyltransferase-like isoleucine patch superfamily enzyme
MIANIFVFEDNKYANFLPLAYLRPVYDLVSGAATLLAKIVRNFPEATIALHSRDYLKNVVKQNHAGIGVNNINVAIGCLLVNGRLLAPRNLEKLLTLDDHDRTFINDEDEVIAMYLTPKNLYLLKDMVDDIFTSKSLLSAFRNKTEVTHVPLTLIEYPWQLLDNSAKELEEDFVASVPTGIIKGDIHAQVNILEEHRIYVGKQSRIFPGVTLNAEKGPIYIGDNCVIKPNVYLEGPIFIGNNSLIESNSVLNNVSLGPKSQINGKIKNSILHGYSMLDNVNLAYSYFADGVDVGHNTVTNTFISPFTSQPDIYVDNYEVKTKEQQLGLFCADFSKIGANISINHGTVMGIASYFELGHEIMPKYIPSFLKQVTATKFDEFTFNKSMEHIEYFLGLKGIDLTKVEKDVLEYVFGKYSAERKASKIIY